MPGSSKRYSAVDAPASGHGAYLHGLLSSAPGRCRRTARPVPATPHRRHRAACRPAGRARPRTEARRASSPGPGPRSPTQRPQLGRLLAAGHDQAAPVRRFGDLTEQRAVALVARSIPSDWTTGLKTVSTLSSTSRQRVRRSSSNRSTEQRGLAARLGSRSGARNLSASVSHSPGVGASRRLRQKTCSNDGARSWARRVASSDLPMPPNPSTATSRLPSSSTHCLSKRALGHAIQEAARHPALRPRTLAVHSPVVMFGCRAVRRRPLGVVLRGLADTGSDLLEPGAIERHAESRRIAHGGGPQRLRLLGFPPDGEAPACKPAAMSAFRLATPG